MTAPTTSPDTGGEADGWIEWSGGENPAAAREVFIKMRRYGAPSPTELRADLLDWHWRSSHRGADIIAYRLATPTPRKAEGVLVPREPTEAMLRAFDDARPDTAVETEDGGWTAPAPDWFRAKYAAMLDAAPTAEVK